MKIKTYNTETFRETFMEEEPQLKGMLKEDFGRFFIVRVEDMFSLMKLPVPPTRAVTHTLIFLTEGRGTIAIGSETYKFGVNECMIVPAGQVFSFGSPDVNKGYLCNFHPDFLSGKFGRSELLNDFEFLRIWGNSRILSDAENAVFIGNLFKRMLTAYVRKGLENIELLQANLIALLCELNMSYKPLVAEGQARALEITSKFKELIHQQFRTMHQVTDYASMLHISPNHLNKCIKATTGKSPSRWIDEIIILEAKVLLSQTHLQVSEIAAETGLLDPSYFSRLFKKYEGIAPLDFRKRILGS